MSRGTKLVTYYGHAGPVCDLAWSPDGKYLVSGGKGLDQTVQIWDASLGKTLYTYTAYADWAGTVSWSPDGASIASAGAQTLLQMNEVTIWNAMTGESIARNENVSPEVGKVLWSPDGVSLAMACRGGIVQVLSIGRGTAETIYAYNTRSGWVFTIAWSYDGAYLASASDVGQVVIQERGTWAARFHAAAKMVSDLKWSPKEYLLASAEGGRVRIWNALTGETLVTYQGHTMPVRALAWSPDGTMLASASYDETIHLWYSQTGAHVFTYHGYASDMRALAWSPDGTRIASAGANGTVEIWQASEEMSSSTVFFVSRVEPEAQAYGEQDAHADADGSAFLTMKQVRMWLASFSKGYEMIHDREPEKEDVKAFVTRWGELGLKTFAYVLAHGEGDDREVTLCTLGYSDDPEAHALLIPFLDHSQARDRWLSALLLGKRKDERARPVLETMLTEFLPPSIAPLPIQDTLGFDYRRVEVAKTLSQWDDPGLVSIFLHAFTASVNAEPYQPNDFFREQGYHFQDRLMFLLGARGAFGVLTGLDLSPIRLRIAAVQLAVGACHFDEFYRNGLWRTEMLLWERVAAILGARFGLTEEEQHLYIETHKRDPRRMERKEASGGMKLTQFIRQLRETLELTPKQAMDLLDMKTLNNMDYQKALEQLQHLVREQKQGPE